jgi:Putative Actinobacterial Holin-X, holin superfamily III
VAKDSNNHVVVPWRDPRPSADWSTLLSKLLDDLVRIVRGEVRLAIASVTPVIDSVLARTITLLVLAVIGLCGLVCLMAAGVLLLHKYLEWWAAFGAMGLGLLFIVVVGLLTTRKSASS